jgi:hypothetical protein
MKGLLFWTFAAVALVCWYVAVDIARDMTGRAAVVSILGQ